MWNGFHVFDAIPFILFQPFIMSRPPLNSLHWSEVIGESGQLNKKKKGVSNQKIHKALSVQVGEKMQ